MARFPLDASKLPDSWRIGRRTAKGVVFAFNLRRRADGGISLANIEHALTEGERTRLLAHFGKPIERDTGGRDGDALVSVSLVEQPGDIEHFITAVYALPTPFTLMGRS